MSNIFNTNKPVAHNGRNGFDLSSHHVFDMRPAVLRPVIVQHTVPNSSYRINCADLVRTSALQTAAFLRGKQELDFFFVPYSQLYSKSNDILFQRGDDHSVAQLNLPSNEFPGVYLGGLVYWAAISYFTEYFFKFFGTFEAGETILKSNSMWHLFELLSDSGGFTRSLARTHLLVDQFLYNKLTIGYDENVSTNYFDCSFVGGDVFKLLSTLGYGDYQQAFLSYLIHWLSVDDKENTLKSHIASSDFSDYWNFILVNVPEFVNITVDDWIYDDSNANIPMEGTRIVNPISLFAYQKVFRDVYRDSINDDDPLYIYASNLDQIFSLSVSTFPSLFESLGVVTKDFPLMTYLHPRRRMFKKDLSCGLWPSSQFGDVASVGLDSSTHIIADAASSGSSSTNLLLSPTSKRVHNTAGSGTFNYDYHFDGLSVSALQMRYANAMQKYRETLLRAGNRTKDLLMSEFGVKSHYVEDFYVRHLGSFSGQLDLNKVSATSDSGEYSVGDLAGNVFSSLSGDTIDFTCNDHGIIIGIMSFVPQPLHNAFGLNPFNKKFTSMDFYHEAFENLGLQPVSSDVFTVIDSVIGGDRTLGFSARYNEYKQNLDLAHDSFTLKPPMHSDWVPYETDGINSNYVCVRPIYQTLSALKDKSYVLPNIMNTLFKQLDSGQVDGSQFHVTLQCSISAVLPMSTLGLPQ